MDLKSMLPQSWQNVLADEFEKPYFSKLESYLSEEYGDQTVYPPEDEIFTAFHSADYEDVKVLLLGQDPYHGKGQGHGLSFSVKPGVRVPPSLKNMYKELEDDCGCSIPKHGYLISWANQGVMLLNAILTVRAKKPGSHKKKGWEKFTDAVIKALNDRDEPVVFLLLGNFAKKKKELVDTDKHRVVESAHPSPYVRTGFFGTKPFSRVNDALKDFGQSPIDWQVPPA